MLNNACVLYKGSIKTHKPSNLHQNVSCDQKRWERIFFFLFPRVTKHCFSHTQNPCPASMCSLSAWTEVEPCWKKAQSRCSFAGCLHNGRSYLLHALHCTLTVPCDLRPPVSSSHSISKVFLSLRMPINYTALFSTICARGTLELE